MEGRVEASRLCDDYRAALVGDELGFRRDAAAARIFGMGATAHPADRSASPETNSSTDAERTS
jgi:hypothetical protein